MDIYSTQWMLILGSGILFFLVTPFSKTASEFFAATTTEGKQPGVMMLTASLVISWIFAKSITVAADLGLAYGIVGGVAYGVYYFSFIVAGIVIYQMRTQGGFKSIHDFLQSKFGRKAVVIFSVLIAFRLFNEVWSNTMVIGSYFGEAGSFDYYISILIFTILTLGYTLKGGLRSSLLTDAIQMILFGLLLFFILGIILPKEGNGSFQKIITSGSWTMSSGLNLFFVALLQIFSYPFHDSVMTDRGFISPPKVTLKSFLWASLIGFICIVAFSFVGVFAHFQGLSNPATVEVSKAIGGTLMLAMNFIMITSAASTMDSTFSSFSKLVVIDLGKKEFATVKKGRIVMILLTIIGTLPIFANPEILSATTVSGTMVMGLAPVFILWKVKAPSSSFFLSVGCGVLIGVILVLGQFPHALIFTEGKYNAMLAANIFGIILCFVLFYIPIILKNGKNKIN